MRKWKKTVEGETKETQSKSRQLQHQRYCSRRRHRGGGGCTSKTKHFFAFFASPILCFPHCSATRRHETWLATIARTYTFNVFMVENLGCLWKFYLKAEREIRLVALTRKMFFFFLNNSYNIIFSYFLPVTVFYTVRARTRPYLGLFRRKYSEIKKKITMK